MRFYWKWLLRPGRGVAQPDLRLEVLVQRLVTGRACLPRNPKVNMPSSRAFYELAHVDLGFWVARRPRPLRS